MNAGTLTPTCEAVTARQDAENLVPNPRAERNQVRRRRIPVTKRIVTALATAPSNPLTGAPQGLTYRDLAREAYQLGDPAIEPKPSQVETVRQAVARLVEKDRAIVTSRGFTGEVRVQRPLTWSDHEAIAEANAPSRKRRELRQANQRLLAESGLDDDEPLFQITESGVELAVDTSGTRLGGTVSTHKRATPLTVPPNRIWRIGGPIE